MKKNNLKSIMFIIVIALNTFSIKTEPLINPPEWIIGTWDNAAESNSNKIIYFNFTNENIKVLKGLPTLDKWVDLKKKYQSYKISKKNDSNSYSISFLKEIKITYEFKKAKDITRGIGLAFGHTTGCNVVSLALNNALHPNERIFSVQAFVMYFPFIKLGGIV